MTQLIDSIEKIQVSLIKTNPSILQLHASGFVSTSGWQNGQLILKSTRHDLFNGLWKFDFIANPPSDIYLNVLTPIEAIYEFADIPKRSIRMVVSSMTNSEELLYDQVTIQKLTDGEANIIENEVRYSIGYSNIFSFDEAFRNAVQSLPTRDDIADKMEYITVKDIGAHIGGFAGIRQLFVKISAR